MIRSVKHDELASQRATFGSSLDDTEESSELVKVKGEVRELEARVKKLVAENKW